MVIGSASISSSSSDGGGTKPTFLADGVDFFLAWQSKVEFIAMLDEA